MSDQAAFAAFDVSRETMERLVALHDLLLKWNQRINLVARGEEGALWRRHIADSAQLWRLRRAPVKHWLDLGSGAGFPGLVVAALAAGEGSDMRVTLVDSDRRKAVFLGEAARTMGLNVEVIAERAEVVPPQGADVVSGRALAPLDRLLGYYEIHRSADGMGLFPKGRTVHKELADAAAIWRFSHRMHRSLTDPEAAIVEVGALARV